ncbi:MAG TPA: hypothetical protein VJJ23_00220 [Candidatus Nanoarchaeia archaeon]|nr:hypothetical protein [Candidatus Nanoarchaeia archaeon]
MKKEVILVLFLLFLVKTTLASDINYSSNISQGNPMIITYSDNNLTNCTLFYGHYIFEKEKTLDIIKNSSLIVNVSKNVSVKKSVFEISYEDKNIPLIVKKLSISIKNKKIALKGSKTDDFSSLVNNELKNCSFNLCPIKIDFSSISPLTLNIKNLEISSLKEVKSNVINNSCFFNVSSSSLSYSQSSNPYNFFIKTNSLTSNVFSFIISAPLPQQNLTNTTIPNNATNTTIINTTITNITITEEPQPLLRRRNAVINPPIENPQTQEQITQPTPQVINSPLQEETVNQQPPVQESNEQNPSQTADEFPTGATIFNIEQNPRDILFLAAGLLILATSVIILVHFNKHKIYKKKVKI